MKNKLSVVLAIRNEEENISDCLKSVKDFADEIIIVDEESSDKSVEIARKMGANIFTEPHHENFHITKQKALELAKGNWILQLDADERVSKSLSQEIIKVINYDEDDLNKYEEKVLKNKLFKRHQRLIEERDGKIGRDDGVYSGFFVPRRNFFMGKYLRYGGTYPDGVIRLVRKDKAFFPCKSVHEQIVVKGKVGWLNNPIYHHDSPTFKRYLERNDRYINLLRMDLQNWGTEKNIIKILEYFLFKPIHWFFVTQIRHKGLLDGWRGIVFSFYSSLRFPRAYFRYIMGK